MFAAQMAHTNMDLTLAVLGALFNTIYLSRFADAKR